MNDIKLIELISFVNFFYSVLKYLTVLEVRCLIRYPVK